MRYAPVGAAVLAGAAIVVVLAFALGWLGGEDDDAVTDGDRPDLTRVVSSTGQATVGFAGGTVSLEGGPEIDIPSGAIVAESTGGAEDISVTISESTQEISLAADFMNTVGTVYEIGPEGTVFAEPVRVTLPIPDGADPADVIGTATLDPASGEWVLVSSTVDLEARTVSAFTTHFSPWGIVGGRSVAELTGGWIQVVNPYVRGSTPFPGARHLPMHLENLVCFTNYAPISARDLVSPAWNVVVATPNYGDTVGTPPKVAEIWLTAGTYTLEESMFASEINNDPLYSPAVNFWTRPPLTIVLTPGMTVRFEDYPHPPPPPASSGFVQRPNACAPDWWPVAASRPTPSDADGETPAATPTDRGGPTQAAQPTEPAAQEPQTGTGGWILNNVESSRDIPEKAVDWCYNSFEVTISGLSATTYARCTWPSPAVDVWNRSQHSWSMEPPQTLTAGEILQITATTSSEGTFASNGLSGGGSSWVRIDLVPGGGPYPGSGWATVIEGDPPVSAVSEFTIPSGGEGGLMLVMLKLQGPGGSGLTTYSYEWQGP